MEYIKISKNLNDTKQIAFELLDILKREATNKAKIIFLSGELGAGKTELTRQIAEVLQVIDRVQSPTFVIMRNLKTQDEKFKTITHIDAYRLNKKSDLAILGISELLKDKDRLIVIEWPENIPKFFDEDVKILIKIISKTEREFNIKIK